MNWKCAIVFLCEFLPMVLFAAAKAMEVLPDWSLLPWPLLYGGYYALLLAFFLGELYVLRTAPDQQSTAFLGFFMLYNVQLLQFRMECFAASLLLFLILGGLRLWNNRKSGGDGKYSRSFLYLVLDGFLAHAIYQL